MYNKTALKHGLHASKQQFTLPSLSSGSSTFLSLATQLCWWNIYRPRAPLGDHAHYHMCSQLTSGHLAKTFQRGGTSRQRRSGLGRGFDRGWIPSFIKSPNYSAYRWGPTRSVCYFVSNQNIIRAFKSQSHTFQPSLAVLLTPRKIYPAGRRLIS